jgi:outer membrane PBP1 activator LpoA protein
MTLRFHPCLLLIALLVLLNACSTGGPRPTSEPAPDREQQDRAEAYELDTRDERGELSPYERNLTGIIELVNSQPTYQPALALDIIRSLESVPSGQLTSMIDSQAYDPEFTEWLELALQVRTTMINGSTVTAAANHWANYHYGHVVTQAGFSRLVSDYSTYFPEPSQVAVLLPAEGGLAAAAEAIRDGILSAYLDQPGESVIRFYSSGDNSDAAISAYTQAREDGATQIVGPLRVSSTRALAGLVEADVPVLLLNEASPDGPGVKDPASTVNSLLLSQTEEATAIAANTLSQGQMHAVVIVPGNEWGSRIETAFSATYESGGGQIAAVARFDPATSDHNDMLTRLLRIDESKQRKTALQVRLGGVPLGFEPIRRDDFDFIFMAANPAEGRELKPLLRFHDAGDIPVYAMSRVFSGKIQQGPDQDLNGIIFATTQWQLQSGDSAGPSLVSVREGAFGDLYAIGRDAWRVLRWLPLMRKDSDLSFPGDIGALHLQADGRLYRTPAWAQFSSGRPVPYQWPGSY